MDDPRLAVRLWGLDFPNPVGLAAGFDKNAEVPDAMLRWGFGFVEAGTVTPRPQAGNPRPRLFRLPTDAAVINRMGFNNHGLEAVAARLTARRRRGIVGANLGKNRDAADALADYEEGVKRLSGLVDYLVINISSPNTPGLRDLQRRSEANRLIDAVAKARDALGPNQPPLLLKIAPDLGPKEIQDLAAVALSSPLDGLVISNTTTARPPTLASAAAHEPGGLSGEPLRIASTELIRTMYRLTAGKIPIVGVGGIASGADAWDKIRAGASLVQIYTALAYSGPGLVAQIKRELLDCMARDRIASVADAVGSDAGREAHDLNHQSI